MDTNDAIGTAAGFVRRQRTKGKSEEEIEAKLRAGGWNDRTLDALWQQMEAQDASASAPEGPALARKAASAVPSAELFTNPKDGYEMALIPAGKAIFGSRDDDADADYSEKPQFEAELPGFYLGIYCVTNAQYLQFVEATGHRPPDQASGGGGGGVAW